MARQRLDDEGLKDPETSAPPPLYVRKCHDCGKKTTQYRCAKCQIRHKNKYKITDSACDEMWLEEAAGLI